MIDKDQLKKMLDHHDMEKALDDIEKLIDSAITRAATTFSKEYTKRFPYLPEIVTSHENMGGHATGLGRTMENLGSIQAGEVRKLIVEKYKKVGYPIKWEQEDVGFGVYAYVIRIGNVADALKNMEASNEK